MYYCSREITSLQKSSVDRIICTFLAKGDTVLQIISWRNQICKFGVYLIYKNFWLEAAVLYTVGHYVFRKEVSASILLKASIEVVDA